MATIQRNVKTYGTRGFVSEVAAAPSHLAPILSNEVDADLDTMYAAWNGGADTVNIKDGAVTMAKLPDAPNGITTSKVNDLQITNAKIADGTIQAGKLAGDAVSGNLVTARVQTIATFGANSTAAFSLFTATNAPLAANRILRWEMAGQYNVSSGVLLLGIFAGASALASFPSIPVGFGNWRVQGLVGPKVSPTTDLVVALSLEVWTGATNASTPSATPSAVEGGAIHAVVGGNIAPLTLAGNFTASHASNSCSIFLGVSYLL